MKTDKEQRTVNCEPRISLSHGAGGTKSRDLITGIFKKKFSNNILDKMDDAADLVLPEKHISVTTDSFVIKPMFFPGGDIGKLSVCGTINDLAVNGAAPFFLTAGFIIEEGTELSTLEKIAESMAQYASLAKVMIVTGDTKVVEKGSADGVFINTTGIGISDPLLPPLGADGISVSDSVILTGTIGDHGIAVLSARKEFSFSSDVKSDCCLLAKPLLKLRTELQGLKFMRDPTRGGLAAVLNEITEGRKFGIRINESKIPVSPGVVSACRLLGYDPLYIANEGKAVIIVDKKDEEKALYLLMQFKETANAVKIGEVTGEHPGLVTIDTVSGTQRVLRMLAGEQFPRIC